MFEKLYNSLVAKFLAIAGYPLFFFIYEFIECALHGGGEVVVYIALLYTLPYCLITALIALVIFIVQKWKKTKKLLIPK